MPTKSGKATLKDIKAGKTVFILATEYYPAYRRVIPTIRAYHVKHRPTEGPKEPRFKIDWKGALEEGLIFVSRRALISHMRLHGKNVLRQINRARLEDYRVTGSPSNDLGPVHLLYSPEEVDVWLEQAESLYDFQIRCLAEGKKLLHHSRSLSYEIRLQLMKNPKTAMAAINRHLVKPFDVDYWPPGSPVTQVPDEDGITPQQSTGEQ